MRRMMLWVGVVAVALLVGSAAMADSFTSSKNYTGLTINSPTGITVGPDGALWFTNFGANYDGNSIGRITTGGVVTSFTDATVQRPLGITAGPDGALWFTNAGGNSIGRITTGGVVASFTDASIRYPIEIAKGPDGALWFTNFYGNSIGRITTSGAISSYGDRSINGPTGITAGPDGALWFTNMAYDFSIGRITTGGAVSSFKDASVNVPTGITAGPDGALWFTNYAGNSIGRITTSGAFSNYADASIRSPNEIAVGPDGALWFTNRAGNSIGRITTGGAVSNYAGVGVGALPYGITAGPDGALWFTNLGGNSIGRGIVDTTPPVLTVPGTTVLNATRPNGATVNYTASAHDALDPTPVVSCAPPSGSRFATGTTTVNCTAKDSSGNSTEMSFKVRVKGAAEQLAGLSTAVKRFGPLRVLVKNAQAALRKNDRPAACSILSSFITQVKAQTRKTIPPSTKAALITDATRIKSVLGCTTSH